MEKLNSFIEYTILKFQTQKYTRICIMDNDVAMRGPDGGSPTCQPVQHVGAGAVAEIVKPDRIPISLDSQPCIISCVLPFLDFSSIQNVKRTCKYLYKCSSNSITPTKLILNKQCSTLTTDPRSSCYISLSQWAINISELSFHRVPAENKTTIPSLLGLFQYVTRLEIQDCDPATWDGEAMATAIASLPHLEELRLHASELISYEEPPFSLLLRRLDTLQSLRKLTIFCRTDGDVNEAVAAWLKDREKSRKLMKLKVSTAFLSSSSGVDVLYALVGHPTIEKLTIMRPDGLGEPVRRNQCAAVAQIMSKCPKLYSIHLRRAGMWTDTLTALVPTTVCPHIRNLKLDSNSLAYLSAEYFNAAIDALLSRVPNLQSCHLGNNQLNPHQAIGLANSFRKYRFDKLENLTLGSNDIGDAGLVAILSALPSTMKQLYLHGCDIHDDGIHAVCDALKRMKMLWGLGLNGNPVTDYGVQILAAGLQNKLQLRDIGITLSDMTDEGVKILANALQTCTNLRFIYLYSTGYKSSTHVTEAGKEYLVSKLPRSAMAAFDHKLSRYLKTPY